MLPESNRKREKFMVQIHRKRSAKLIEQSRKRREKPYSETDEFLDKVIAFVKEERTEGLEALTMEFVRESRKFNFDELVDRALAEANPHTFALLVTILNFAYETAEEVSTPKNLPALVNKCFLVFKEPWGKVALGLINTLTLKQKGVCELLSSSEGMLQAFVQLCQIQDLISLIQKIFESICETASIGYHSTKNPTQLFNLLKAMLKAEQISKKGSYTMMIKDVLQDIDDEEFGLSLLEKCMGDFHNLATILKQNKPDLLDRKRSIAQVLQILFYSDEHVVATLMLSGFGEYIEYMVQDLDPQIMASGFVCLDSILQSDDEEIVQYVKETNLVNMVAQAFVKIFSSDKIQDIKTEVNLIRSANALIQNDAYESKLALEAFLWNCGSRLQDQHFYYDALTLIENAVSSNQKLCQILELRGLVKIIEGIAESDCKQTGVTQLAERIIEIYDGYVKHDK